MEDEEHAPCEFVERMKWLVLRKRERLLYFDLVLEKYVVEVEYFGAAAVHRIDLSYFHS